MRHYAMVSIWLCASLLWLSVSRVYACDVKRTALEETLLIGLQEMAKEISLAEHEICEEELRTAYRQTLESHPHLFYVSPHFSYTYDAQGRILGVLPAYRMSFAEAYEHRQALLRYFQALATEAKAYPSEGDRAFFIFLHLLKNYEYSPPGEENYDIASLLSEGHGVCQAFSLMLVALGRAVGLEADMVTSPAMDHAWNHMVIEGRAYHVDVTRSLPSEADPSPLPRFLLGNEDIEALGYRQYSCYGDHRCTDDGYVIWEDPASTENILDSVYIPEVKGWLWSGEKEQLQLLSFVGARRPHPQKCGDLNGDGRLSLEDLLLPALQDPRHHKGSTVLGVRCQLVARALVDDP